MVATETVLSLQCNVSDGNVTALYYMMPKTQVVYTLHQLLLMELGLACETRTNYGPILWLSCTI